MNYENVLHEIGPFGRFQKCLCGIVLLTCMHSSFSNLLFAFFHYVPEFHCSIPPANQVTKNSTEYQTLLNRSIPWTRGSDGELAGSQCELLDGNGSIWSNNSKQEFPSSSITLCKYGRTFEHADTPIAEFDLVCEDAWKGPLIIVLYFAGMGTGSLFERLSDRFGRRPVFLIFIVANYVATGLIGFSWNYESYAIFVFAQGFCGLVNYVAVFVMATETMEMKRRADMGLLFSVFYAFGYTISPLLAYLFPYWRHYVWATALFGVVHIPLLWLCPESVRWLLVSGKEKEAKALLHKIAIMNGRGIDANEIYNNFQLREAKLKEFDRTRSEAEQAKLQKESNYLHMLKNKTMLIRSCVLWIGWCIVSMLYYAISLNPSTLSGDRIVNSFLIGLIEFPALGLAYVFLRFLGRVRAGFIFFCVAGVSCCVVPLVSKAAPAVVTFLVLIGKGSVSAAFAVMYVVSAEVPPTLVRTAALGICSGCARLGAIIMPYLMFAGQAVTPLFPFLVMGGLAAITGLLMALVVPETGGAPMPDTINDALQNKRIYGFNLCKKFPKADMATLDKTEMQRMT